MSEMELNELNDFVAKGKMLQRLLKETPEIIEYLKLAKEPPVLPIRTDCLVLVAQAAKVLAVSRGTVYQYVKEGLLKAYYTPGSGRMKLWRSDLQSLATTRKGGVKGDVNGEEAEKEPA